MKFSKIVVLLLAVSFMVPAFAFHGKRGHCCAGHHRRFVAAAVRKGACHKGACHKGVCHKVAGHRVAPRGRAVVAKMGVKKACRSCAGGHCRLNRTNR